jgi:hypothetical protein
MRPRAAAGRLSDAEILAVAREIRRATGVPPSNDPRHDICSPHAELPREDEDRVIRAVDALARGEIR